MKKHLLMVLLCAGLGVAKAQQPVYPHLNVDLVAHINPETDTTGQDGRKYSGCWGWYQANKNREYALSGTSSGVFFIDITNPINPVVCDSVSSKHAGSTWREVKTYQNYCYVVSDDYTQNGLQIIDMSYLPDSVHVVYNSTNLLVRCHTIWVDGNKLYCGGPTPYPGTSTMNMQVYSLANPAMPTLLRTLSDDYPNITYVHDMMVVNDTVYASCANQGLFVFKYNANNTFSMLAAYTGYVQSGYNHSSAITDDRKTVVFCDEVPANLVVKVIDVSDLNNITLMDTVRSHVGDTPHNPYIMGNHWAWVSSYMDGIYLYDISNPANVTIAGYFDTSPQHGLNDGYPSAHDYSGNWGAYPYLPSKLIIANDMQNGVYILQGPDFYNFTTGINDLAMPAKTSVYPNPANTTVQISFANATKEALQYTVSDLVGHTLLSGVIHDNSLLVKAQVDVSSLANGCYLLTTQGGHWKETHKVLISK